MFVINKATTKKIFVDTMQKQQIDYEASFLQEKSCLRKRSQHPESLSYYKSTFTCNIKSNFDDGFMLRQTTEKRDSGIFE
jgi:hypothetical protein